MFYWAVMFFIIALVSAAFGFTDIEHAATGIAKILFFVFVLLAVLSVVFGRKALL